MNSDPIYTTYGPVRGCCGHRHTLKEARKCLRQDREGCSRQGGYSDRDVCLILDGYLHDANSGDWIRHPAGPGLGGVFFG